MGRAPGEHSVSSDAPPADVGLTFVTCPIVLAAALEPGGAHQPRDPPLPAADVLPAQGLMNAG
jgi:hypothetical protein